jgi:hypothetical protein
MPGHSTPFPLILEADKAYRNAVAEGWPPAFNGQRGVRSAIYAAAEALRLRDTLLRDRLTTAALLGLAPPGWPEPSERERQAKRAAYRTDLHYQAWLAERDSGADQGKPPETPPAEPEGDSVPEAPAIARPSLAQLPDRLLIALRRRRGALASLDALAEDLGCDAASAADALHSLAGAGFRVEEDGGHWRLDSTPQQAAFLHGPALTLETDAEGWITLGVTGDNHLGSKYERLDVLEALYDEFAAAGAVAVLNAGNWIDGEARFNTHDLLVHGLDGQMRYLARHYPTRPGIVTYAVAGDDHEGWYAQREGVDVGRYAERTMRDAGREDWVNLGYMEAPIRIVHPETGRGSILSLVHPGGGSAYALSYSVQKIIESLDGGEKPAVAIYGHYHKLHGAMMIRNVWAVQSGCTQDQTPFMRKKKLEAHVGGLVMRLRLDPVTGAVPRCVTDVLRYYNRGYYAGRWSHAGGVYPAERIDPAGQPVKPRIRVPAGTSARAA